MQQNHFGIFAIFASLILMTDLSRSQWNGTYRAALEHFGLYLKYIVPFWWTDGPTGRQNRRQTDPHKLHSKTARR